MGLTSFPEKSQIPPPPKSKETAFKSNSHTRSLILRVHTVPGKTELNSLHGIRMAQTFKIVREKVGNPDCLTVHLYG